MKKMQLDVHTAMMQLAIEQAEAAITAGEVPVGAVVYTLENGKATVVAAAHNETISRQNPTHHAEFLACTRAAEKLGMPYLEECYVAITLEPCAMCAQALSHFRVKEIRFGASDPKSGGTVNNARVLDYAHHKPVVYEGILEDACAAQLSAFFQQKREKA